VLQWALINGEKETGATLHYMDPAIDAGDVIAESRFPLDSDDDAVSVRRKLKEAGSALLREWWPRIADGSAPRTPQDEARAKYWRLRRPEEGRIDVSRPAEEICRLVRALNANRPGAYIDVGGIRVTVTRAERAARDRRVAGQFRLAAADGDVLITEASVDGRLLSGDALASLRNRVSQHQPVR
jgi:methionyl-tRNA formyltransferase